MSSVEDDCNFKGEQRPLKDSWVYDEITTEGMGSVASVVAAVMRLTKDQGNLAREKVGRYVPMLTPTASVICYH